LALGVLSPQQRHVAPHTQGHGRNQTLRTLLPGDSVSGFGAVGGDAVPLVVEFGLDGLVGALEASGGSQRCQAKAAVRSLWASSMARRSASGRAE